MDARFPFHRTDPLHPPPQYAEARATRPILPVTLYDGRRAWLLTRYDDLRAVTTDPRFSGEFANPDFPAITAARRVVDRNERAFVGMDNPRHDHYRRMFTKEFSTRRMMALRPRMVVPGEQIIKKGDIGREMYVLARGEVEVLDDAGKVVKTLKDGDFFGEIGVLTSLPRTAKIGRAHV